MITSPIHGAFLTQGLKVLNVETGKPRERGLVMLISY